MPGIMTEVRRCCRPPAPQAGGVRLYWGRPERVRLQTLPLVGKGWLLYPLGFAV